MFNLPFAIILKLFGFLKKKNCEKQRTKKKSKVEGTNERTNVANQFSLNFVYYFKMHIRENCILNNKKYASICDTY